MSKKMVIIGMGALMEKMLPCFEALLGDTLSSNLIATTADAGDIERKRAHFPFRLILNDNKEALEEMNPDIIVFAVPPQLAAEVCEKDIVPYYQKCRDKGREIPVLYVFPPRPAADYYLEKLGSDLKVCHILPNVILSIAGKKLEGEGLNFITISDKSVWNSEDRETLERFMSGTGECIYILPKNVMAIMTSGVSVINYAFVLNTMKDALLKAGYEIPINTLAQGCRYALEEHTGFRPHIDAPERPVIPETVIDALYGFTTKYYDGLMEYCLGLGLPEKTAKDFLDGYFDFYLHYYMCESDEAINALVASQTTKGGVAEKGEIVYREQFEAKLFNTFTKLNKESPSPEFFEEVREYVVNCSKQVLEHGMNMGKKQ